MKAEVVDRCDACGDIVSKWQSLADGLCRDCVRAGIERCEWCRAPAPGPRRGYPDPPADPRPVCAEGHYHTLCPDCDGPDCPYSVEARVAKALMGVPVVRPPSVPEPPAPLPHEEFGRPNGLVCDECGTECVDRCLSCGAPQCCPRCCAEAVRS